jgi:hypothetical protein
MTGESKQVSPEVIRAAMERYPGYPVTLAVSKYMMDELHEGQLIGPLLPGSRWGGVHLERVGEMIQKLADAMYHQRKKSIDIKIECEDFPDDWDHIGLEVTKVESGKQEEIDQMALAGWPCCACDDLIKGDDTESQVVMLDKLAKWGYPTWGNVLTGVGGRAVAVLCGKCIKAGEKARFAIKKDDKKYSRVPLTELEDLL